MCDYCSGKKEIDSDWLEISIEGNQLDIDYNAYSSDSSFHELIKINFCPMCGEKIINDCED